LLTALCFTGLPQTSLASGAKLGSNMRDNTQTEGDSASGHGGGGSSGGSSRNSSGSSSGPYKTLQAPSGAQSQLNIAALEARLAKMRNDKDKGNYTTGSCGLGVRKILDIVMPRRVGSSANAGSWSTTVLNKWAPPCYSQVRDSSPTYQ